MMRERLIELLQEVLPGINLTISDTLVDDGILDSLAITSIIAEISMEFGISIPFDELESRNFNSIDSMLALIERCPKGNMGY